VTKLTLFVTCCLIVIAGCLPRRQEHCSPVGATRCTGDAVELCGPGGDWEVVIDCADLTRTTDDTWECTLLTIPTDGGVEEGHFCVPAEEPLVAETCGR